MATAVPAFGGIFSCTSIEGWPKLADSPERLGGVASNITSLSPCTSAIPCDRLQTFGSLFPKLKVLRYEPVRPRWPDPRLAFNPREFGTATEHFSETLEALSICRENRGGHHPWRDLDDNSYYIGWWALKPLEKLRFLEGSTFYLIGEATVVGYDQSLTDNFVRAYRLSWSALPLRIIKNAFSLCYRLY